MPLAPLGAASSGSTAGVGSSAQLGALGGPIGPGAPAGVAAGGQAGGSEHSDTLALRRASGRARSAGGEEDIFSAIGGLELDPELRPSAHGMGGFPYSLKAASQA